MKRTLITLILTCLSAICSYSQTVSGKVIDATTKEVIPFATISLHRPDSTIIQGAVADEQGIFNIALDGKPQDGIWLRVSSIGYKTHYGRLDSLQVVIHLSPDTQSLAELVVRAKRPAVKINSSGSIESLVSGTPLANYTDIMKLLQSLPGVITIGGSIKTLNGASPIYYIDNRKVLSMSEVTSLDVKSIKKIEINNNPGIEYDGEVGAIIKITTIKPGEGLSLSLSSAVEKSRTWSHNEQLSGSYSKNHLTFYGSVNYDGFQKKSIQDIWYTMNNGDFAINNHLVSSPSHVQTLNYSLGADYTPSEAHSINVAWNGYNNRMSDIGLSSNNVQEKGQKEIRFESKSNLLDLNNFNHIVAYYEYNHDNGLKLSVTGDYALSNAQRNQTTKEEFEHQESEVKIDNESHNQLASLMADLSTPLGEIFTLQVGGQYDYLQNRNSLSSYARMAEKRDSHSQENIFALYSGVMFQLGAFNGKVGLRYERGKYQFHGNESEESYTTSQLLPYFSVSFPIQETSHLLSYRYSTIRPPFGWLGNYSYYLNRYSIQEGNPTLRPQYIHRLDYSLVWQSLYFSANYQYIKDPILALSQLVQYDGHNAVKNSWYNLQKQHNLTLLLNYSTVFHWYQPSLTVGYIINVNYLETEPQKEERLLKPLPFVSLQNTFSLPSIDIKLNYQFIGKGYSKIFLIQPQHILDLSLQKSFLDNSLTISLYCNDILRQAIDRYTTSYRGLVFTQIEDQDRARIGLKISYRLRSIKSQQIESSDQLQRL